MSTAQSESSLDASHILVVDDDVPTRRLLKFLLEGEGLAVTCVADGDAAIREYQERSPDLILLDEMMPNLDGVQLHRKLRQLGYAGPVVFITARPDMPSLLSEEGLKVAGCLLKPLHVEEVLLTVRTVLVR